jgi:hypothetical protein
VIERWIAHLLGVAVSVETVASIEDRDWRWFIGSTARAPKIGNALWNGTAVDANASGAHCSPDAPDRRWMHGWSMNASAPGRPT